MAWRLAMELFPTLDLSTYLELMLFERDRTGTCILLPNCLTIASLVVSASEQSFQTLLLALLVLVCKGIQCPPHRAKPGIKQFSRMMLLPVVFKTIFTDVEEVFTARSRIRSKVYNERPIRCLSFWQIKVHSSRPFLSSFVVLLLPPTEE